jgi:hypothetical protein
MVGSVALRRMCSLPWPKRSSDIARAVTTEGPEAVDLADYIPDGFTETVRGYAALGDALQNLNSALLGFLTIPTAPASAVALENRLDTHLQMDSRPPAGFRQADIAVFSTLANKLRTSNGPTATTVSEEDLESASSIMANWTEAESSPLHDAIDSMARMIQGGIWAKLETIRRLVHCTDPGEYHLRISDFVADKALPTGRGGRGGRSGTPGSKPGTLGADGVPGKGTAINIALDGRGSDLDTEQAYVFPEHCQMLLNKADAWYFGDERNRQKAAVLYLRLIERLGFLKAPDQKFRESSLASSYDEMAANTITISPLLQMRTIYRQATSRLKRITLGHDIFGHSPTWVPRLSLNFYKAKVEKLLQTLMQLEGATADYENGLLQAITVGVDSMRVGMDAARSQIELLTGDNGILQTSIFTIAAYTPQLKEKSRHVKQLCSGIRTNAPIDPELIIDGISTLISLDKSLSSALSIASFAQRVYQSTQEIKDADGDIVKKEYFVKQISTCTGSLESLAKAYTTNKDNTIDCDEPGAPKTLAAVEETKALLCRFKNSFSASGTEKEAIDRALGDFMDTAQKRNEAVLQYNSAIQLLSEARTEQDYYAEQIDTLGQKNLQLAPNLPSIVFWLRKTTNAIRLDLMQRLNYEARAIRYWGLRPGIESQDPSPLRNSTKLRQDHGRLEDEFERCLSHYAGSIRSTWPNDEQRNFLGVQGLLYQLTTDQVEQLKKGILCGDQEIYTTFVPFSHAGFEHLPDFRLSQIRVWLLGVTVDRDTSQRQLLRIHITHMGEENIWDPSGKLFTFAHDRVNVQFTYDVEKVTSLGEVSSGAVHGRQELEHMYNGGVSADERSMAPIGPFTTWRIEIKEAGMLNKGLCMDGLRSAYLEFWGANRAPAR